MGAVSASFETVFAIGERLPPAAVAARVWRLLARLPTNYALRGAISGISKPWEELLARGSVVRLLYGLQIVCSLLIDPPEPRLKVCAMNPPPTGGVESTTEVYECLVDGDAIREWEAAVANRSAWRLRFVESGGVDHVASIFEPFVPAPNATHAFTTFASMECAALLCGLLRSIVDAAACILGVEDATSVAGSAGVINSTAAGASTGNIALHTAAFSKVLTVESAKRVVSLFHVRMIAALVRVCETVAAVPVDDAIAGIISSAASVWATALLLTSDSWEAFVHRGGGDICAHFIVNVIGRTRGPVAARAQAGACHLCSFCVLLMVRRSACSIWK